MRTFQQFCESKKPKKSNYQLKAVMELVKTLRDIFKKYSLQARRNAWEKLTSKKAEKEMDRLLVNPSRNINKFRTI